MLACNEEHQMYAAKWYNVYSRFERLDNESKKRLLSWYPVEKSLLLRNSMNLLKNIEMAISLMS